MIIKDYIFEVLADVWPTITIAMVVTISLRIAYLIKKNKKVAIYKELIFLMFIIYTLCLFHVVTYQDISSSSNNFVPLREIGRYTIGSDKFFKNIIGNILMFIPYGFFSSYIIGNKKMSVAIILTLIVTLSIEFTQLYIGRIFDIDDVILNLCGGILGFLFYKVIDKIKSKLPKVLRKDWAINTFVILVLIIVMIFSFDIDLNVWLGK